MRPCAEAVYSLFQFDERFPYPQASVTVKLSFPRNVLLPYSKCCAVEPLRPAEKKKFHHRPTGWKLAGTPLEAVCPVFNERDEREY